MRVIAGQPSRALRRLWRRRHKISRATVAAAALVCLAHSRKRSRHVDVVADPAWTVAEGRAAIPQIARYWNLFTEARIRRGPSGGGLPNGPCRP